MTRSTSLLYLAIGIGLAPTFSAPARAQSGSPLSVQLSGLYKSMSGANSEEIPSGPGAEFQLRYTRSAWSIAVGVDYATHSPEFGGKVTFYGGFLEPRYTFDVKSDRFAPYLSARVGFAGGSARYSDVDYSESSDISGTTLNAGGGLLVTLSQGINLDLGVTIGSTQFSGGQGTESATGYGTSTFRVDPGSLEDVIIRFGLSIGLKR